MAEVTAEVVTSEAPVAAPQATPTPDSTAEQAVVTPEGKQPEAAPEKLLPQSEVDKLIAKTRAQESRRLEKRMREQVRAEVERDTYKQQLEDRNRQPPKSGEPKVEDFKVYEDWVVAKAKYELRQELDQHEQQTSQQRQQRESQMQHAEKARLLHERLEAASDEYPDIKELVQGDVPFTEPMVAAVLALEHGGKVAGYLATHTDEASKIAKLDPVNQVIAFYELGKKLTAAPRPTQTPPPIVPNSGRAPVEKRLEEASSQEEFNAIRKRQIAARKR